MPSLTSHRPYRLVAIPDDPDQVISCSRCNRNNLTGSAPTAGRFLFPGQDGPEREFQLRGEPGAYQLRYLIDGETWLEAGEEFVVCSRCRKLGRATIFSLKTGEHVA